MLSRWPHCTNQLVAPLRAEGVRLQIVVVHYPVPFVVHPSLPEHARPQLVILIILSFLLGDRNEVFGVEGILGTGKVPCLFFGKF